MLIIEKKAPDVLNTQEAIKNFVQPTNKYHAKHPKQWEQVKPEVGAEVVG